MVRINNKATLANAKQYSNVVIVCDSNTKKHCLPRLLASNQLLKTAPIVTIAAGEQHKNLATVERIITTLLKLEIDRNALLIGLGGGVLLDIVGWIAMIYKRGIAFCAVPTSLLAMVDAAHGGKRGINIGLLKNAIGGINTSELVVLDTTYLDTLPYKHIKNGYVEMLKHGLIADAPLFWKLATAEVGSLLLNESEINSSIAIKTKITTQDPTELGLRKVLNAGHSLGHAFESYYMKQGKALLHGEAVALGLIGELYISHSKNLITLDDLIEITNVLLAYTVRQKIPPKEVIIKYIVQDKKNNKTQLLFSLINGVGTCKYDVKVSEKEIAAALKYLQSIYHD